MSDLVKLRLARIARNVRSLRESANLSLGELAERSGLSKSTLSQIESDKANPTVSVLSKLAEGLGVDMEELFRRNPRKAATMKVLGEPAPQENLDLSDKRVSLSKSSITKQRILEKVIQLYMHRGFQGTGMATVAEQLSITPAALYYHFQSKEGMHFAANRDGLIRLTKLVRPGPEIITPTERLRYFAVAHARFQLGVADLTGEAAYSVTHLKEHLSPEHLEVIEQLQVDLRSILWTILTDGHATGEFRCEHVMETSMAIFGMSEYLLYWFKPTEGLSRDDLVALYADYALMLASG